MCLSMAQYILTYCTRPSLGSRKWYPKMISNNINRELKLLHIRISWGLVSRQSNVREMADNVTHFILLSYFVLQPVILTVWPTRPGPKSHLTMAATNVNAKMESWWPVHNSSAVSGDLISDQHCCFWVLLPNYKASLCNEVSNLPCFHMTIQCLRTKREV